MLRGLFVAITVLTPPLTQDLAVDERPATSGEWGFRPADGSTGEVNPPAFVWRPQKEAARYEWQASRDASFANVERRADIERIDVHCPPAPFEAGEWTWRFRYHTDDGETSAWSRSRTFRVTSKTPVFTIPARDELLTRVPRSHPRLFVRPEQIPALQRAARGALADSWAGLLARCEKLCAQPPPTEEPPEYPAGTVRGSDPWRTIWWGNRRRTIAVLDGAAQLAFAWCIGGEERFALESRRLLLEAAAWNPKGSTGYRYNDEAGMPYAYHFARTYTFLHDFLTESERESCRQVMLVRGREMYQHLSPRHLWQPYSSHSNRAWHFLGEVGIAFLGEIDGADDWLDFAMRVFGASYPVWSDGDGGWHEGLAYWRSYLGRFTWWADVMRNAVGVDAFQVPFFSRVGDFALYLQPPGTRGGGFGDQCGSLESSGSARLVRLFAQQAGNGHWQWYADAHGPLTPQPDFISFLRAAGDAVEAREPDDLPTSKLFEGTGVAVLNRTLEDAAQNVSVIFKSSPFGTQSHGYEAQNSFLLYAFGERLAIRSGKRDSYGSEHHKQWMWSTRSTNSITVSGHGQIEHSGRAVGRITGFSTSADFDFVEGEAGGAYGQRLQRFTRSILFVKPDWIVIFDRLRAPKPETFEWWLHAEQPMQQVGEREFLLRAGDATCAVRWLWPENLQFEQTDRFDPPPRPRVKLVEHHLTASTVAPAREGVFVTLLRPDHGDQQGTIEVSTTVTADGLRVQIEDPQGPLVVLLRTGEHVTHAIEATRTEDGEVVSRFASGSR